MNYWFSVSQELIFYFYPHSMFSNFGNNSTASFMSRNQPFKHHSLFFFYPPFSFSLFSLLPFHPLSPSHSHFSHSPAPFFSPLFALGCFLATAISILKGWEGPPVLPRLPVFPAVIAGSNLCVRSQWNQIPQRTPSLLCCLSPQHPDNDKVFYSKKFCQTISQCFRCYH